ncbi:NTP transferase domain-containing protein [Alphaproteobacteria bacterium]|nr:NTP transferase domain-containing protein [Alphaproteobacteria bacterium]
MNIIIPMAGRSQRFKDKGYKGPKYMLPLGDHSVIEHLVTCFAPDDRYHFIISRNQVEETDSLQLFLESIVKFSAVHVIDDHNFGPAHSVLQIIDAVDDRELLITYCDFLVDWDYKAFESFASGWDCVIPTFSGFQPASFGDTLFAYIHRDDEGRLLELREKQCFTDNRMEEPASVGIYYFSSKEIFSVYAREVIADKGRDLPEAYVSLLANPMVRDGLAVATFDVAKFICLGTPRDYEEFIYWQGVFQHPPTDIIALAREPLVDVNLLPMAGNGSRFRAARFNTPKPLLAFNKAPLIEHATRCLPTSRRSIYICRMNEFLLNRLRRHLTEMVDGLSLINLGKMTAGQLDTCLAAAGEIEDEESVFIASCDYSVKYDVDSWDAFIHDEDCDVAIWTNQLGSMPVRQYEAFGYCEVSAANDVTRVVEKVTLGPTPWKDPMIVGSFWFRNWKTFRQLGDIVAERGSFDPTRENFIGVNVNYLIEMGYKVKCFWVDEWISYGDPFEYEMIHFWSEYFERVD